MIPIDRSRIRILTAELRRRVRYHLWHIRPYHDRYLARTFPVEQALLAGRNPSTSDHRSIICFGAAKAATRYVKSILGRCCSEAGIPGVDLSSLTYASDFPYLRDLSDPEQKAFVHVFHPRGYFYGIHTWYTDHIPCFDRYLKLLLVRDPRDIVVSKFFSTRYSHAYPYRREKYRWFRDRVAYADDFGIDAWVVKESERVRTDLEEFAGHFGNRSDVLISRYEDMVADFKEWLTGMLFHCELQISDALQNELLKEAETSRATTGDVSSHRRQITPGEHQLALKPETIARLDIIFAPIMDFFSYLR